MLRSLFAVATLAVLALCGCQDAKQEVAETDALAFSEIPLRVAVAESDAFADRVADGWLGFSDQKVDTTIIDTVKIDEAASKSDVLIIPASEIGNAVRFGLISRLPDTFLDSPESGHAVTLAQLKQTQTQWRGSTYGLSLGSPTVATLLSDGIEGVDLNEELTFDRFAELAEAVSGEVPAAAEPLADGEAAFSLLRRAAGYCETKWLFDTETFEPTIDSPAFVQALEDMVAVRKFYPDELLGTREIWQRLIEGKLKLAIGAPLESADIESGASIRVLPAPRCSKSFRDEWVPGVPEVNRVLLSGNGLIAVIPRGCRQTGAARAMIAWLSTEGIGPLRRLSSKVSVAHSQDVGSDLSGRMKSPVMASFDQVVQDYFTSPTAQTPLRIPRREEYLQSLNEAVLKALAGEASATEALQQAKTAWVEISESADTQEQRAAWEENRAR